MSASARPPAGFARVFVYGTLRQGEGNHRLLLSARFVGEAHTVPGFALYDLGAFPGLVREGAGTVTGELYDVDEATLAALDRLEGVPSFYRRERIELEGVGSTDAYTLTSRQVRGCDLIPGGDWKRQRRRAPV
jgi:gamma-glutamylaminecyclotransferase